MGKQETSSEELINEIALELDMYTTQEYKRIQSENSYEDAAALLDQVDNSGDAMFQYLADMCKDIYATEVERENSLLQQASNMQAAFSFVTAGLFVIAQIVADHRGSGLTPLAMLIGFSAITGLLLASLWFATSAQKRYKHDGAPTIEHLLQKALEKETDKETDKEIESNNTLTKMLTDRGRTVFTIEQYAAYYASLRKVNEKRAKWIKISMFLFKLSIVVSVIVTITLSMLDGLK